MKRWQTQFPRGEYVDDPRVRIFCKKHEFTTAAQVVSVGNLTIVAYKTTRLCFFRDAWDKVPDDGVLLMHISPTQGPARHFCASKRELGAAFGDVTEVPKCWDKSPYAYSWPPGKEPPAAEAFLFDSEAEPASTSAAKPIIPRFLNRGRRDLAPTASPGSAVDFGRAWWARRVFVGVDSREYLNEVARWRDLWKPEPIRFLLVAESHVAEHPDDHKVLVETSGEDTSFLRSVLPKSYVRLVYCLGYGDDSICRPKPAINKPTEFWKIFEALAEGDSLVESTPAAASLCEKHARVLEVLRRRGIWLVDASVIPLYYPGGWRTFPPRMASQILRESFEHFVKPAFADHPIKAVWTIGESVALALKGIKGIDEDRVCPQPNRRNPVAFNAGVNGMKQDILESL